MGRKRRRKSQSPSPDSTLTSVGREEHFHTPFQDLKALLSKANVEPSAPQPAKPSLDAAQQSARERALAQQRVVEKRAETELQQRPSKLDDAAFLKAMADVESLAPDPRGRIGKRGR